MSQFPAIQSLFSIANSACFAFSTAISIDACLFACLFSCEDIQIGFFSNFKPGLKISISSFSRERSLFYQTHYYHHQTCCFIQLVLEKFCTVSSAVESKLAL